MRPRYRAAVLIAVAFAGCTAFDHHESFTPRSWVQAALHTAGLFAFAVTVMAVMLAAILWATGDLDHVIDAWRQKGPKD